MVRIPIKIEQTQIHDTQDSWERKTMKQKAMTEEDLKDPRKYELMAYRAKQEWKKGFPKAEKILQDEDKIEKLLQKLEKKLAKFPMVGPQLANVVILASMIRSYSKKEYTEIPLGSLVAAVSALVYFITSFDLIPDFIPGAGMIDDALVIKFCMTMIESDVKEYGKWRIQNGKVIDPED